MTNDDRCWCAELPDHFPGKTITSDVRLASVLDAVGDDHSGGVGVYECAVCGQRWVDRYEPSDPQHGVHRA